MMYQKTTLDNGLRVATSAMPNTHSVAIGIFIAVGSRYEVDAEAGISHFTEHLLFKGTARRPTSRQISEAIEGVGGILNGGTDKELTVYWCKVARPHFSIALDVLTDMLLNSLFDSEELEKERQVIIEEINMSIDSPQQRVHMLLDEQLWPEHPLGRDIAGTKQSVVTITRDVMLGYLSRQYQPGKILVAVAGDIQHEEVVTAVRQTLGNWASRQEPSGYSAYKDRLIKRLCVEKRDIEQAHLCLALPGLSLLHPRRFPLDLLNVILGEGMSSRLFAEVRDRLGLAYSIHSSVDHYLDSGSLIIYAGVDPKNLPVAIKAVLEQLAQLKEKIPEAEITKAKELSKGRLLLRMEDTRNVVGWMGGQEILTRHILTPAQVVSIIDSITSEEIKKVAREVITGDKLRLAVVGPVSAEETLEELLVL